MKKILVTGAAGFIGFHAIQALKKRGDTVIGLDNFNDYYDVNLKYMRCQHLKELDIQVINGDICDKIVLHDLFEQEGFTHVLHLAAQAGVRYALTNPDAYVASNLMGFVNILESCRRYPNIKLIYASSSSVYGRNEKIPFSINDTTEKPANLYAATKKANELIAYSYNHLFNLSVTGLRFFTVYGPWGRPDMAYFSFTKNILEDKPITLFNQGQMRRDFTYIDDVVSGILAAIDLGASCEVFNIGNHQPEELLSLVTTLEDLLGKKAIIKMADYTPGEVEVTYADISESTAKLGFYPKTSLKLGLTRFIEWYDRFYGIGKTVNNVTCNHSIGCSL